MTSPYNRQPVSMVPETGTYQGVGGVRTRTNWNASGLAAVVRRIHRSKAPNGQPENSARSDANTVPYPTNPIGPLYAPMPTSFAIGFQWHPGLRPQTVLMHNKTMLGDTNVGSLQLTPPLFMRWSVSTPRSVAAGARDNARNGQNIDTRIIMPVVNRR